jgi:hypothetical protein
MRTRTLWKTAAPVMALALFFTCAAALAGENPSNRLAAPANTKIYLGTGLFTPYEGDLDSAVLGTVGLEYSKGPEAVFTDVSFAQTNPNINLVSDVKNLIVQLGYKKALCRKFSLGGGVQVHRMDFGFGIKKTRTTLFALVDRRLTARWRMRLQASLRTNKGTISFGGYTFALQFKP